MWGGVASAQQARIDFDFYVLGYSLRSFRLEAGRYPTEAEGLMALVEKPATYPADRRWKQVMKELPDDPWDHPYRYLVSPSLDEGYGLYSTGKDGVSHSKGNDLNDWNSWSENGRGRGTFMQHLGEVPLSLYFGLVALGLAVRAAIRARFVDPLK